MKFYRAISGIIIFCALIYSAYYIQAGPLFIYDIEGDFNFSADFGGRWDYVDFADHYHREDYPLYMNYDSSRVRRLECWPGPGYPFFGQEEGSQCTMVHYGHVTKIGIIRIWARAWGGGIWTLPSLMAWDHSARIKVHLVPRSYVTEDVDVNVRILHPFNSGKEYRYEHILPHDFDTALSFNLEGISVPDEFYQGQPITIPVPAGYSKTLYYTTRVKGQVTLPGGGNPGAAGYSSDLAYIQGLLFYYPVGSEPYLRRPKFSLTSLTDVSVEGFQLVASGTDIANAQGISPFANPTGLVFIPSSNHLVYMDYPDGEEGTGAILSMAFSPSLDFSTSVTSESLKNYELSAFPENGLLKNTDTEVFYTLPLEGASLFYQIQGGAFKHLDDNNVLFQHGNNLYVIETVSGDILTSVSEEKGIGAFDPVRGSSDAVWTAALDKKINRWDHLLDANTTNSLYLDLTDEITTFSVANGWVAGESHPYDPGQFVIEDIRETADGDLFVLCNSASAESLVYKIENDVASLVLETSPTLYGYIDNPQIRTILMDPTDPDLLYLYVTMRPGYTSGGGENYIVEYNLNSGAHRVILTASQFQNYARRITGQDLRSGMWIAHHGICLGNDGKIYFSESGYERYFGNLTEESSRSIWAVDPSLVYANSAPSFTGAVITPDPAYGDSTLSVVCSGWQDADGDPEGYRYQWKRNNVQMEDMAGSTLSRLFFAEGDSISCVVTAWDGGSEGNSIETAAVTIERFNYAPSFDGAVITPDPAFDDSTLSVVCTGWEDQNGDPAGYLYQWKKNGTGIGGATDATLAPSFFNIGDSITCVVTAWDGYAEGNTIETAALTISDRTQIYPFIGKDVEQIHFEYPDSQSEFHVWNAGVDTLNYTIEVSAGQDYFDVNPKAGASTGESEKIQHTVTVDRDQISQGQTVTGQLTIRSSEAYDSPQYISLSTVGEPIPPTIGKNKNTVYFWNGSTSETLQIWNTWPGISMNYSLEIIEGGQYFSVSPDNDNSTSPTDIHSHLVLFNQALAPNDLIIRGKLRISSTQATNSPQDVNLSVIRQVGSSAGNVEVLYSEILDYSDDIQNNSGGDSWVQYAPNGMLGMAYMGKEDGASGNDNNLIYLSMKTDGTIEREVVDTSTGLLIILLYDSKLQPHLFANNWGGSRLYHYYKLNTSNVWHKVSVTYFSDSLTQISGAISQDDSIHLLAIESGLSENPTVNLKYLSNKGGPWSIQTIDTYKTLSYWSENSGYVNGLLRQDFAIDANGNAHAVYGVQLAHELLPSPNPQETSELRYATNMSGGWEIEVAVQPSDNSCNAGWNPNIAMQGSNPIIVSTFLEQVPSLSAQYAQLLYTTRAGSGGWSKWAAAGTADGYYGGDGGNFTGFAPHLFFDIYDHPHILFNDIASSHDEYGNYLQIGQIRYAHHNGADWQISTLIHEPSPSDYWSGNQIRLPCIAVSPGGGQIHAVAIQVNYHGDYNYDEDDKYTLLHLHALNKGGDDSYNVIRISGWTAPGTLLTFTSDNGVVRAKTLANEEGLYSFRLLPHGWSGKVTPLKEGNTFDPPERNYTNLMSNLDNQNFTGMLPTGTIEGSVLDTSSGTQPSGATVKLYNSDGSYTGRVEITDSDGNLRFREVPPGDYFLVVSLANYLDSRWPETGSFNLSAGGVYAKLQIPLIGIGSIQGSVLNTLTGTHPRGAVVKLFRSDDSYTGRSEITDSEGSFSFVEVPTGDYYLIVSLSDYYDSRWPESGSFNLPIGGLYNSWLIPITRMKFSAQVREYILGKRQLTGVDLQAADANSDGVINITDLILLVNQGN
ncbi:carboxypeptidase regulatory-like domain-containing protein [Candidatus Sumerlaeota bacterium]